MSSVHQMVSRTGIRANGDLSVWATGDLPAASTTQGTDTTPVVTEAYFARVFVPVNAQITGLSILNGSAVAGNMQLTLYGADFTVLGTTASTAQAGTAGYQAVPFVNGPIIVRGPQRCIALVQFNNTSARFRSHPLGVFTAGKLTGQVYGTVPTYVDPNTFTASLGPIASTY